MNGADLLCDALLANGVDTCFANPGTSEMHFVAALDRKPQMRCILGLFEGVVTGAADGYARMADKPAATLLHLGPGLANGLANLHNARRARTPMINIVGDHASHHLAFDAPLTTNIESLARPMSDWVRRIAGPGAIAADAAEAWRTSQMLPGIATLILPADSAWGEVAARPVTPASLPARAMPGQEKIAAAAKALRSGRRPALLITGHALRAGALEVAGRIAAKVGARLLAPTSNGRIERGAGRVAIDRIPYPVDLALAALSDIDVLILVGAAAPVAFFGYPGKPSRLTAEECLIVELGAPGDDLNGSLAALAEALGVTKSAPVELSALDGAARPLPSGALSGDAISAVVAKLLPAQAIVCDESITAGGRFYPLSRGAPPHDYLQLTGGAIGIGIPLAAGAAVACPGRKVIGLQADGSAMYTVQGLWTQARENLDVVTIIFANRAYAVLQGEMRAVGVNQIGANARRMLEIDEPPIDWVALAGGMGVEAARATTVERFTALLEAALARPGPFLIEAVI
jgi:acetolactate synthase-1/2/3 large subunit